jgi:hypothetical protein
MEIENSRELYNTIGRTWCPALNDYVTFNSIGFKHLIWKKKKYRSRRQQRERLALLPHAPEIIAKAITPDNRRIRTESVVVKWRGEKKKVLSKSTFWAFKAELNGRTIRVVVRQVKNGHKHFFSIFEERKQKSDS